jgi:heptosyltransferase-2
MILNLGATVIFKTDCRHWRGDKPCLENRLCEGCPTYAPWQQRILLIKLGARGDVLRTTPLIAGLRQRYPHAHLTWLTQPESLELLEGLPGLDRLLAFSPESVVEVMARSFEIVICLDKEPKATGLASLARAPKKLGWGLAAEGVGGPYAFTTASEYSLALGVSDELKFRRNTKTYLQIVFEALGLKYAGERYVFTLTDADRERSQRFFRRNKIRKGKTGATPPLLGLFTGCGPAFPLKRWTESGFAQLARRAQTKLGARVLLMAGPEEQDINARIRGLAHAPLLDTRGEHTLRELAGFLEACRVVVTGDTVALHLALALGRPTVALFGPTAQQEVDLFGMGEKVVSPAACAPCYRVLCDRQPSCMDAIRLEEVWRPVQALWRKPA